MSLQYVPIEPPPGIWRGGSEYESGKPVLRWYTASLVRNYGREVGPWGGWRTRSNNAVTGKPRAILPWRVDSLLRYIAVGTEQKLYIYPVSASGGPYDITPAAFVAGHASEVAGSGFGGGVFGGGPFGVLRPDTGNIIPATVWDLDIWSDELIACCESDGRIVLWALDTGVPAAVIAGAPTDCVGVVVAEQGFVMALGAGGNPRSIQWSDQGDAATWTPTTTNQAGDVELVTSGQIRKGVKLGPSVLILTDLDAHIGSYSGLPFVWTFEGVGHGCGTVSKGAVVPIGQRCSWWSKSGFWLWDGSLQPLACNLWDDLQLNLNQGQLSKISGFHNSEHGELVWFYPSSASSEIDSYVAWSYRADDPSNAWNHGMLVRLCGYEPGVFHYPLLMGDDGLCYEHEVGNSYNDSASNDCPRYVETGPLEIGNGERTARVMEVRADERTHGLAEISFKTRDLPNGGETTQATVSLASDGRGWPRFDARQTRVRIDFDADASARMGQLRLGIQPGGRR